MMERNLIAENWRLERARYALVGNHCTKCDVYFFPTKPLCVKCHTGEDLVEHTFSDKGKLIEWTQIQEPTGGFELMAPFFYGIVELDHGVRVSCQLTCVSEDKLEYNMPIRMVFRKLFEGGREGIITYGLKAEPVCAPQ